MIDRDYIFANRAVAFLDVLGFGSKLIEFDAEARAHMISEDGDGERYVSHSANKFISTFFEAISLLDPQKYRYYLFSDNICITSIEDTSAADLEDLLFVVSNLYYDLAKQGYFIRGGIDYGLFVDEGTLAVGMPLAVAYNLESKVAVYPRIVLSDSFIYQFSDFRIDSRAVEEGSYISLLFRNSCELTYLNVFMHVFQTDYEEEKIKFFTDFNTVINENLVLTSNKEVVHMKYKWLAKEYDKFIDLYTSDWAFLDENFDPEDDFLNLVKEQKITYAD